METTLPSQLDRSLTPPSTAEELGGILEIPDFPEITGGYADIYHGFWTNSQGGRVEVAIKVLRVLNPRSRKGDQELLFKKAETRIKREVFFWSQTKHPNLHPLLGYRLQPQPQLVSPWCRHGDLGDYLRNNPSLSRFEKLRLIHQAGCGLRHLHSGIPPICHADIKPGNVLINDLGQAVLSDFGLSRTLLDLDISSGFTTSETVKGTFAYMAGELSYGEKPSRESDMYAFGGLILTVMSDLAPFHGLTQLVILRRIIQNEPPKPEDHPSMPAQDPLWELMRRCWDQNPVARPTIDEVLVELGGHIAPEESNPLSSADLPSAIDHNGSDHSRVDLDTPGEQQQGGITSLNMPRETRDPVLRAGPEPRGLSVSSKDDPPLPPYVSTSKAMPVADFSSGTSAEPSGLTHGVINPVSQVLTATPPHPPHQYTNSRSRRAPIVYPALLSRVAEAFRTRLMLSERVKDGLAYQDAFDGREAVDKIAYIIKTTDRNLALRLARALESQKLFHDVTYNHLLTDNPHEIYQFNARLANLLVTKDMESTDDASLPSGVFTFLTDCYSPSCTRDALCYSIACPRRLEQQARLNMKPEPVLKRSLSDVSLGDASVHETGTMWIHSVPTEIAASVSDQEKKRQEAINEVIYTERDFVRDMEYLRECWVKPLRTTDILPEQRRTQFVQQVFWNLDEIIAVNTRLRDALNRRQKSYAVVETIGDIYLDVVKDFEPFVRYGSHQLYGKFEFEREKSSNAAFAQFVAETERLPESRKLELNGYLTKPTTRLARYPLLLEVVLKYTSDDNPDKVRLVEVVKIIRGFLKRVNEESGKTESRFNLLQLDQQLVFRNVEQVDLRLRDENRELLYKGTLKRRGGQGDNGDLQVFLFDHALLMVKAKTKHEQFRVYKRPIPLELLVVAAQEEPTNRSATKGSRQTIIRRNSFSRDKDKDRENGFLPLPLKSDSKNGYPITFMHLGRKGYVLTLWASTVVGRKKWLEEIAKQQEVMRERSMTFDTLSLSEGFFFGENKVNCAAPFNHGSQLAYGTDNGVYFSDLRDRSREPVHVLALLDVMQVDVLEEYELLVVLSERSVMTIPLEALDMNDPTAGLKRAKKVSSHTSFFKAGTCFGRTLVCVVKASALSSTIKTLEPIDQAVRGKNKPTSRKLLQGGNDTLRIFKEFYIPTESSSIHFLKTKLCVGCTKGFEIVDLETLDTQELLDPADSSFDFVQKRENTRPIAIYRIENEFLLCYDEFAFYVNKNGWRARPNWIVHWEGYPTSFALHYPFVLAFEPTFIEIRNIDTGQLVQIIPGNNLRCLFADTPPSITHSSINPYIRGNPYIYPQSPGALLQEHHAGDPGAASGMPLRNQPYARDEIIIASDDKVMAVRLAPSAPRQQLAAPMAPSASRQQLAVPMVTSDETFSGWSVVPLIAHSEGTFSSASLISDLASVSIGSWDVIDSA